MVIGQIVTFLAALKPESVLQSVAVESSVDLVSQVSIQNVSFEYFSLVIYHIS